MKNANIFVDVDLTLVDQSQQLIPGVAGPLAKLRQRGCQCTPSVDLPQSSVDHR